MTTKKKAPTLEKPERISHACSESSSAGEQALLVFLLTKHHTRQDKKKRLASREKLQLLNRLLRCAGKWWICTEPEETSCRQLRLSGLGIGHGCIRKRPSGRNLAVDLNEWGLCLKKKHHSLEVSSSTEMAFLTESISAHMYEALNFMPRGGPNGFTWSGALLTIWMAFRNSFLSRNRLVLMCNAAHTSLSSFALSDSRADSEKLHV